MTRKEFYLKSILAMAMNPSYVNVEPLPKIPQDDSDMMGRQLDLISIEEDARDLLEMTDKAWPGVFEEDD